VADYESANYIEYIFKKEKVLVLEFNVLTPASLTEHYLDNNEDSEDNFWFHNNDLAAIIGETLRNFKEFAEQNLDEEDRGYLMKLSEYKDEAVGTTTAYRNGAILSERFEVPQNPPTPVVHPIQITHEGFKFNITKSSIFTLGCLVSFISTWGLDPGSIGSEWAQVIEFPEDVQPDQDIEISIEKRHPFEAIQFHVQYLTDVGRSRPSEEVSLVTRASSPPRDLVISDITTETFCLSWLPPEAVPEAFNLTQDNFDYVVKIMGKELDKENRTSELELILTDLKPGTWYSVTVTAHFNNPNLPLSTYPSFPATSNLMTKPLPPSATVDLTQVKNHEIIFHLEPPSLPENVEPLYYLVRLCRQTGDPQSQDCSKEFAAGKSVAITNVARGNNYTYSAKVITTEGESDFSPEDVVETSYTLTEYEQAKADMFGYLDDVASDVRAKSSFCGFTDIVGSGVVGFDRVTADSNVDGASIDGQTGLVTVGAEASYQVSLSLQMKTDPGSTHKFWVSKNGENMDESLIDFSTDVFGIGESVEWGSRNIVLQLLTGDTLNVVQEITGSSSALNLSFCVALMKA